MTVDSDEWQTLGGVTEGPIAASSHSRGHLDLFAVNWRDVYLRAVPRRSRAC